MRFIDLNCDLGEGAGHDAELMGLITSANIACGAHAGDEATMRNAVVLALVHGVAIGAHPGFPDRENFGRLEKPVLPSAAGEWVRDQFGVLQKIAVGTGGRVGHLKLHGALYNMASRDRALAEAVVAAVRELVPRPALVALAGSVLEKVARSAAGVRVVSEVFADRAYEPDGSLTPRSRPGAVLQDEALVVARAIRLVGEGLVRSTAGSDVCLQAGTICLHGDTPRAATLARRLRREFRAAGIEVRAFAADAGEPRAKSPTATHG